MTKDMQATPVKIYMEPEFIDKLTPVRQVMFLGTSELCSTETIPEMREFFNDFFPGVPKFVLAQVPSILRDVADRLESEIVKRALLLCGQSFGTCPQNAGGSHVCDKPENHDDAHRCSICGMSDN